MFTIFNITPGMMDIIPAGYMASQSQSSLTGDLVFLITFHEKEKVYSWIFRVLKNSTPRSIRLNNVVIFITVLWRSEPLRKGIYLRGYQRRAGMQNYGLLGSIQCLLMRIFWRGKPLGFMPVRVLSVTIITVFRKKIGKCMVLNCTFVHTISLLQVS
ncbi:hypothetical protein CUN67_24970 (plasmid) [Pantoea cypripedii]|uniref:Uncharacterized protein n=1 Tax=Pantoea cypripedii TaxID=55209 RepID=A0A6B9GG94_PANCY|nr:hypothetical protein CUN67_24970 [Pantoea cypripedii]